MKRKERLDSVHRKERIKICFLLLENRRRIKNRKEGKGSERRLVKSPHLSFSEF
jgi:hypothetical protein